MYVIIVLRLGREKSNLIFYCHIICFDKKKNTCAINHILERMNIRIYFILEKLPFVLSAKAVSVQIKCGINPVILFTLDSVSLLGRKTARTTILKGMYVDPYILNYPNHSLSST